MRGGAEGRRPILATTASGPLITGLAGLAGVALGALITIWNERHVRREQALRELEAAALHVLARAKKIHLAEELGDQEMRSNEIYHLGGDLERHLAAMAAVGPRSAESRRHWDIYESATAILMKHDTSKLDQVIGELEQFRKELTAGLREETSP